MNEFPEPVRILSLMAAGAIAYFIGWFAAKRRYQ